jgi:hypothetical protein
LPSEGKGHTFESCRVRHFGTELGTPELAVFALEAATSVRRSTLFRSHDTQFFLIDFDTLCERALMIAAVAAAIGPSACGRSWQRS